MGRKPNPLILEFFERGPKLADQSNRYQHTCRKCGEDFPKGRPDTLMDHLLHRCPRITDEDRNRAYLYQPTPKSTTRAAHTSDHDQSPSLNGNEPPIQLQREPSALDTLAEVSRQHLDLTRQRNMANANGQKHNEDEEGDHGLSAILAHIHQHGSASETSEQARAALSAMNYQAQVSGLPQLVPYTSPQAETGPDATGSRSNDLQSVLRRRNKQSTLEERISQLNAPASNGLSHQARRIMTIGNAPANSCPQSQEDSNLGTELEQVNQDQEPNQSRTATLSPQPPHHQTPAQSAPQTPDMAASMQQPTQPFMVYMPALPTVPPARYGLLAKSNQKKQRNRFSDNRRKEVHGIRKLGACIRCRMLKKPCSEGTPCSTCNSIENARLWKNSCIRTRIADEITLYSTAYFHSKAQLRIYALNAAEAAQIPGHVEVSLFPETNSWAKFMAFKSSGAAKAGAEDESEDHLGEDKEDKGSTVEVFTLNFQSVETSEIPTTVEHYINTVTEDVIEREPEGFLSATLALVMELSGQHDDVLVPKVLNLWVATNLLAFSHEPIWTIAYSFTDNERHVLEEDSTSYQIIQAQILASVEQHCQKQARTVLTELERRLLARQQTSALLTFLVALILLNAVERMTWLFRSFGERPKPERDVSLLPSPSAATSRRSSGLVLPGSRRPSPPSETTSTPYIPPDWPLTFPPSKYWDQGVSFSELLNLLLRMRGLPPSTHRRDDGSLGLKSSKTYQVVMDAEGKPMLDPELAIANSWLEKIGLTVDDLDRKVIASFDIKDARSWDLKFIAQMLLPQP